MSTSKFGRRTALGAFVGAAWTLARPPLGQRPTTTTTACPTTTTPAALDLATTLGAYPGFGGVGCNRLITVYEPFLGRQYRYAIQNMDYHPTAWTSSAWGLTNETGGWQNVGADDARHVRLAVTVPLRLAIDGNRGSIASTVRGDDPRGADRYRHRHPRRQVPHLCQPPRRGRARQRHFADRSRARHRLVSLVDARWQRRRLQDAFRRCRAVFKSVSASFAVDYNVDSDALLSYPGSPNRLSAGYPGDDAVDVVGIDMHPRAPWDTIRAKLDAIAAFAAGHGKPMSVPEWGLWKNETGDSPMFIQHMHDWFAARPASGPGSLLYQGYFWHHINSNFDPTTIGGTTYVAPNAKARYQTLFGG